MYMMPLVREKEDAIRLRRKGLSYREILKKVPVAKSTLSLWLQKAPLTSYEKRILKHRRNANITLGKIRAAGSLHRLRLERDAATLAEAQKQFLTHNGNPLFQLGLGLYWAEGAKRNSGFAFTNSDADMMVIMLLWMKRFLSVQYSEIRARLYIHRPYAHERCEEYWSKYTNIPLHNFGKTIYKPTGLLVKKRPNYKGCLRIETGRTAHLRKMLFWTNMLVEYYREK